MSTGGRPIVLWFWPAVYDAPVDARVAKLAKTFERHPSQRRQCSSVREKFALEWGGQKVTKKHLSHLKWLIFSPRGSAPHPAGAGAPDPVFTVAAIPGAHFGSMTALSPTPKSPPLPFDPHPPTTNKPPCARRPLLPSLISTEHLKWVSLISVLFCRLYFAATDGVCLFIQAPFVCPQKHYRSIHPVSARKSKDSIDPAHAHATCTYHICRFYYARNVCISVRSYTRTHSKPQGHAHHSHRACITPCDTVLDLVAVWVQLRCLPARWPRSLQGRVPMAWRCCARNRRRRRPRCCSWHRRPGWRSLLGCRRPGWHCLHLRHRPRSHHTCCTS